MRTQPVLGWALALAASVVPFLPARAAAAAQPRLSLAGIPAGSTIDGAFFSINVRAGSGEAVHVHRISAPWVESEVTWNNFGGAYDPALIASFPGTPGWQSADITDLVQDWVDGALPNHGILLEQGNTPYTNYRSSEDATPALRPMLEIFYTPPGGEPEELVLQRPGAEHDTAFDAYIWELNPDNVGNWEELFTGLVGMQKMSLVRFEFSVDPHQPGTGTPGYWKNHPCSWPVNSIVIGGHSYPRLVAIVLMHLPVAGDKSRTMFSQLVAAKLNVLIGNRSDCIDATIAAADAWMAAHPFGSHVSGGSSAWAVGAPLAALLDDYNNGLLCAPHRD